MEETKIWAVEGTSAAPLNTTKQLEDEGLFEEILTKNPGMLEEGLQLVGRQTSTAGGPLDLLGVDIYGKLVVFELKRGRLNRDAVAQVIDYASDLNALDMDSLYNRISEQSGNHEGIKRIDDFGIWYDEFRSNSELLEEELEPLVPPRMVLVGLGVDDTTERMVNYMSSGGMNISLLTFHGFVNTDGKSLLARNSEVSNARVTGNSPGVSYYRASKMQFENGVQFLQSDIQNLVYEIESMFKDQLKGLSAGYRPSRKNFSLDYSWQEGALKTRTTLFIEINSDGGGLNIGFYPPAIGLVSTEEFNKEGFLFEQTPSSAITGPEDIDYEFKFPLNSPKEWDLRREQLTALTQKVREAYQARRAEAGG